MSLHLELPARAARLSGLFRIAAILLLSPAPAGAYSGGPPDGYAGDPPGYHACTSCHSSFPINSGNGSLDLQGLPAAYEPGRAYPLTVYLTDPGQRRWGFEMTVIRAGDGLQAGTFTPVDATAQVSEGAGDLRDYAKQTTQGTFPNAAFGSWQILWTAPPEGSGPVRFYVAGNAANYNNANSFDYIYAIVRNISPTVPVAVEDSPAAAAEFGVRVHPNPVRDFATIRWSAPTARPSQLRIVDILGRTVRSFPALRDTNREIFWDGRDSEGRRLPGGLYACALTGGGRTRTFKFVVLP